MSSSFFQENGSNPTAITQAQDLVGQATTEAAAAITAANNAASAAAAAASSAAAAASAAAVAGGSVGSYLAALPTTLPGLPGQPWLNGRVVCIS